MKKETLYVDDFNHSAIAVNLASFSLADGRFKSVALYASAKNDSMFYRVVGFDDHAVEVPSLEAAVRVYNRCRALPKEA